MNQMVMLSALIHFAFIGIISTIPILSPPEKKTYSHVHMVSLVNLPPMKAKPVQIKKISAPSKKATQPIKKVTQSAEKKGMVLQRKTNLKTITKTKPVNLLSEKKESYALAKLQTMEKDFEKDKQPKNNNEIEEKDISDMLLALDEIIKAESESGFIDKKEETKDQILERLNKLGEKLPLEKENNQYAVIKEKSKSLEKLEEIEKNWREEIQQQQPFAKNQTYPYYAKVNKSGTNEALERLSLYSSVSSQNVSKNPPFLSVYFEQIKNKARTKWENPSGAEILSETETNKKTIVLFNILRSGKIEDYKIHKSSGNHALDRLALMAVKNSDPLPPLPLLYDGHFLRVFIDFNYSIK